MKIEKEFKNPFKLCRPIPWWCWNGKIDKEEMESQMRKMKEQKFYEFFYPTLIGEVWINNKKAGIRPWQPYLLEITDYI